MSQELSDLVEVAAAVGGSVGALWCTFMAFSRGISYKDTMGYYSLADKARQQALGKPQLVEFLKEDFRNILASFGGEEPDLSYRMKYIRAYLESKEEQDDNKFIGYRKIKEDTISML